jgi:hypothetical protein
MRESVRQVAELTGDARLAAVAQQGELMISFEHLRGRDLDTRVVVRRLLTYGPGESEQLGRRHEGPPDPRAGVFGAGHPGPGE